ncbi:MAG: hypothetical protein IJV77_07770 [Clostridia bacterium]|nr:hypothetical protein [Clostridia bacterium]
MQQWICWLTLFNYFYLIYMILLLFILFFLGILFLSVRGVCLAGGATATPLVSRQAHALVPRVL